jgi:ATP-dependent helicase HrpA
VEEDWDSKLPFIAHNRKLLAQVEELEHKSRRQDVLVDDSLIHAFYDQHLPQPRCAPASRFERWYREASRGQAEAAAPEPRRVDAARGRRNHDGQAFPKTRSAWVAWTAAPRTCMSPVTRAMGVTVTVPDLRPQPGQRRALRVVGAGHAGGEGDGVAQEPAPAPAQLGWCRFPSLRPSLRRDACPSAMGTLVDVLLQAVRERSTARRAARRLQARHAGSRTTS